MLTSIKLVLAMSMVVTTMGSRIYLSLDLTLYKSADGTTACVAPNNKMGICVHESICNEDHTIMPGGVVDDSDYRSKKQCPIQTDWCCTEEIIPHPQIRSIDSDKCLAPESDICPWCVLLYKYKTDGDSSFLPGCINWFKSHVIITSSTCLKATQKKMLYAQAPYSANPGRNYTVLRRQFHPKYNSGSHENDFGIIVIENDVVFKTGKSRGACIDFLSPFQGECVGYGLDDKGKISSTFMTVSSSSCTNRGNVSDAACGICTDEECIVAAGGPILCLNKSQGLHLQGIARNVCDKNNKVLLGGISHSWEWIESELALMNISNVVYT